MVTKTELSDYHFFNRSDFPTGNLVLLPSFLEGEFGKAVHNAVCEKYKDFPVVTKGISYNEKAGVVEGSQDYYCVAVNEVFREQGLDLRTPAQARLEKIAVNNELPIKGNFYVDSGVALRSAEEPNKYLAEKLIKQKPDLRSPSWIHLYDLELEQDSKAPGELCFKLRESANPIYAPILNEQSRHFSSKDINEETGLPKQLQLSGGDRYFYTAQSGLHSCGLYSYLGLFSYGQLLDLSLASGRVVVVGGVERVGARENFKEVLKQIDANYKSQLKDLNEKRDRAKKTAFEIMQGKL